MDDSIIKFDSGVVVKLEDNWIEFEDNESETFFNLGYDELRVLLKKVFVTDNNLVNKTLDKLNKLQDECEGISPTHAINSDIAITMAVDLIRSTHVFENKPKQKRIK